MAFWLRQLITRFPTPNCTGFSPALWFEKAVGVVLKLRLCLEVDVSEIKAAATHDLGNHVNVAVRSRSGIIYVRESKVQLRRESPGDLWLQLTCNEVCTRQDRLRCQCSDLTAESTHEARGF